MKFKLLFSTIISLLIVLYAVPAYAADTCQPIYGGGQICPPPGNIVIDKKIFDPINNKFVDNLGVNDTKFNPEQIVVFRITITNNGQKAISDIKTRDIFPQFVKFVAGPGKFDAATNTLNLPSKNLDIKGSFIFDVSGQVFQAERLPKDRDLVCVVNQAIAQFEGKEVSDNAQFCIQKRVEITPGPVITPPVSPVISPVKQPIVTPPVGAVVPPIGRVVPTVKPVQEVPSISKGGKPVFPQPEIVTTPPTGPEMLPLMALLPSGVLGFFLRRKSKSV